MLLPLLLPSLLPPLLTLTSDGQPLRLGVCLPAAELAGGLRLQGAGAMQWRRLPVGPSDADLAPLAEVWIELGIVAPRGLVRIVRGGAGPCPDGRGPAFVFSEEEQRLAHGSVRVLRWHWLDGTVDERSRTTFTARTELAGEFYDVGEGLTHESAGLAHRADSWQKRGQPWAVACGLLPARSAGSAAGKAVRKRLAQIVPRLVEMEGRRGAGDFLRADQEVTNLEFDTTLALLRCAVGLGERRAWQLALRAAGQLRDRDLDVRTGLPFVHGLSHREVAPEPGHVWLEGVLWVGLLSADDDALLAARSMGRALAVHLPVGTGRNERMRDYAWPLLQLETLERIDPAARLRIASDRLVAAISARFDGAAGTFRFGEGELGDGVYLERGWLTAGILIPALRRHLARRSNEVLREQVAAVQQALLDRIGSGARGLPTHWRIVRGRAEAEHFERNTARSTWLLEGLAERDQLRLLQRSSVRRAIDEVPALDHPDLATEFTMLGRCMWPWR